MSPGLDTSKDRCAGLNVGQPSGGPCRSLLSSCPCHPPEVPLCPGSRHHIPSTTRRFLFGRPDLSLLRRLCTARMEWTPQQADELLLPVLKSWDEREVRDEGGKPGLETRSPAAGVPGSRGSLAHVEPDRAAGPIPTRVPLLPYPLASCSTSRPWSRSSRSGSDSRRSSPSGSSTRYGGSLGRRRRSWSWPGAPPWRPGGRGNRGLPSLGPRQPSEPSLPCLLRGRGRQRGPEATRGPGSGQSRGPSASRGRPPKAAPSRGWVTARRSNVSEACHIVPLRASTDQFPSSHT